MSEERSKSQTSGTLGRYIGELLLELGCRTVFTVPGDAVLPVLNDLCSVEGLNMVNCAEHELNAFFWFGCL